MEQENLMTKNDTILFLKYTEKRNLKRIKEPDVENFWKTKNKKYEIINSTINYIVVTSI